MKPLIDILEEKLRAAIEEATGRNDLPALVKAATDARFGDYQANGIMAAAEIEDRPQTPCCLCG